MKRVLLLSFMLIGLAFMAVGYSDPNVIKQEQFQVDNSPTVASFGIVNSLGFAVYEKENAVVEVAEGNVVSDGDPEKGFASPMLRPPANNLTVLNIS